MAVPIGSLLRRARGRAGLSLRQLADRADTSSATLSNYEQGHKEPRLGTVERLVGATGHEVVIAAWPAARPMTREDRRSRALHAAIAERLLDAPGVVVPLARRNLATMRAADPDGHAGHYLDRWAELLDQPVEAIAGVLVGPSDEARDLRQNTPFAGVLTPAERWSVYREHRACAEPTSTT